MSVYYNALQLTIPDKDTTYWCSVYSLPEVVTSQERYIVKVHHIYYHAFIVLSIYELSVALCHNYSLVQSFQSHLPDMCTIFSSICAPI